MERQLASTKTTSSKQTPIPPDIHVVCIRDVEYYIYWEDLEPGSSFFLPTTVSAAEAYRAMRPHAIELGFQLEVRNRCEYGRYGVRVWRMD